MTIQIDTREKPDAIIKIQQTFNRLGVKSFKSKLYVGDYMNIDNPKVVVDRKQNLLEVASNIGGDHERFRRELIRAQDCGYRVIILCEHGEGIESLEDVIFWKNPRLKKNPNSLTGEKIYTIASTMSRKYGVSWEFCNKEQTGERIVELLK